jgi:predicted Zn-dependent peptidase
MTEFRQATTAGGLRVVAEVDRRGYSAAIGYFVDAGARDETDREAGLSHFLEHMMFKGTARRSASDVNRELDELGGHSNAYTSEEHTVYYAAVLPKFQDRIVELLTDMLSPALRESDFETERHVILEEIAKYEDQPPFGAFERAMELYFSPRGLGRRVLGTDESIGAMTAEAMRDFFHRRYRPENIVLAASGNLDFDGLVAQAETLTEPWTARPLPPAPPSDQPDTLPPGIELEPFLKVDEAAQAYQIEMMPGPGMASDDRFATGLLAAAVGDEGGSRLFWDLIDTGRAEVATVWPQEFSDTGVLFSYLVCAPGELASNQSLFHNVIRAVAQSSVGEDELEQARNKALSSCIMQSERPSHRLFGLGTRWLTRGEYLSTDELLDRFRAVDLDAVAAAATRYLTEPAVSVRAAMPLQPVTASTPGTPIHPSSSGE